ncbi:MAG: UdgX family uracil-DNA binding protein [Herminiimonas sp.]|nr:UdgX family uracil-DNA binding protein [Herminiimonas sp.]
MTAATLVVAGTPLLVQSFAQWRDAARALLAQGTAPHTVQWIARADEADLFSGNASAGATVNVVQSGAANSLSDDAGSAVFRFPRAMVEMLQSAACCRVPDRWAFLYRIVWRWQAGERDVLSAADPDGSRLHAMVKAVRREEHDMHAYVRFRERPDDAEAPRFVAWFEPAHDVLPQVAQHFARRMGRVSWMIGTPDASVMWDGTHLHATGPLMRGAADIDDAGEALWLTYYRSIFNPARLNVRVMESHIPSRFWKNLPESSEVPAMVADAAAGARRIGQVDSVGRRSGTVIAIAAERAQPRRAASTTLDQCRRCELWQHATQAIGGTGPATARIMLVGEQPGDQEDLAGQPFVGPAGQLLDRVMSDAGLDRKTVYLTNAVKHFKWEPRGKRRLHKTPAQQEILACRHWLAQELDSVGPEVIVALGNTALRSLVGTGAPALSTLLGKPFRHEGRWIVVVYHPAYVLRVPDATTKKQAMAVMIDGLQQAQRLAAI